MFFASDNWSGAAPEIADALSRSAAGYSVPYGRSDLDHAVEQRFNELFEREVAVFFVSSGTAANALALSALSRPGGVTLCHRDAHLVDAECGAPEYFTTGGRMAPVDGPNGKLSPDGLKRELARFQPANVQYGQLSAVSLTQATEAGTAYTPDEVHQLADLAHAAGAPLHMDGARFANAIAHLGVSPAEMTWRAGVDVLSFGGTKNGCWCAEAVVFFDPERAEQFPYLRKRAGQLFSKSRFVACQFDAYLEDGLWLRLAQQANDQAQRLAEAITSCDGVSLAWPTQSNVLQVVMPTAVADRLYELGAKFYPRSRPHALVGELPQGAGLYRLVTSYATTDAEIDRFVEALQSAV